MPNILRVGIYGASVAYCGPWAPACAGAGEAALSGWQGASDRQILRNSAISAAQAYGINYVDNSWALYSAGNIAGKAVIGAGVATASDQDVLGGALAGGLSAGRKPTDSAGLDFAIAVTAGGTASELTGGKFANGAYTVAFVIGLRSLPNAYNEFVGYELDMRPGGAAVGKEATQMPVEGANNIGTQHESVDPGCLFCEGGRIYRALNKVLGINAVAGVHDVFQVKLGVGLRREIFNIPGMPVAAAFYIWQLLWSPLF